MNQITIAEFQFLRDGCEGKILPAHISKTQDVGHTSYSGF